MNQNIIDICQIVQFEKNRNGKCPKIYEKRLKKYLENENISFTDKVRCLECLDDYLVSYQELKKISQLDLETVIKNQISSMYFINHLVYSYMLKVEKMKKTEKVEKGKKIEIKKPDEGFLISIYSSMSSLFQKNEINKEEIKKENNEEKEKIDPIHQLEIDLFAFLATGNTIVRGTHLYQAIQLICGEKKPKYLAGVGMLYEMEQKYDPAKFKTIEKHIYETLLYEYYYHNQDNMVLYLVPILQLFHYRKLLTVEVCDTAIHLVGNDIEMIQDLADFFVHNLRNYVNYTLDFRRFVEWGERFIRGVERGLDNQVLTSSQSVHLLDSNRQKFMEWLEENSQDFDIENKKCLKMQAFEKMKNKIFELSKTSDYAKVKATLDRFQNDNTNIIYTNSSQFNSSLNNIFERICYIVANHKLSDILFQRLLEELIDSAGTCFSGHLNRLFNIFSGFETDLVNIDILKELERTLKVHLQNIYNASEKDIQEKIMDLLSGENVEDNIKDYLRDEIKKIYHKLHEEFSKQIEIEKFDQKFFEVVNVFYFDIIDSSEVNKIELLK